MNNFMCYIGKENYGRGCFQGQISSRIERVFSK